MLASSFLALILRLFGLIKALSGVPESPTATPVLNGKMEVVHISTKSQNKKAPSLQLFIQLPLFFYRLKANSSLPIIINTFYVSFHRSFTAHLLAINYHQPFPLLLSPFNKYSLLNPIVVETV